MKAIGLLFVLAVVLVAAVVRVLFSPRELAGRVVLFLDAVNKFLFVADFPGEQDWRDPCCV